MKEPALNYRVPMYGHLISSHWRANAMFRLHNENVLPHDHEFMEIAFVLDGEAIHRSALGDMEVQAGDVFMLSTQAWHSYYECRDLQLLNCFFGEGFFQHELAMFKQNRRLKYLFEDGPSWHERRGIMKLHLPPRAFQECLPHVEQLREIGEPHEERAQLRWMAQMLDLLALVSENIPEEMLAQSEAKKIHPAVQSAFELLQSKPAHAWKLEELGKLVHVHPSYLLRLFKRDLGVSPMTYLMQIRAENAARLLLQSDAGIAEIGSQVGWSDPSYFALRFKAHFGITAQQYRARFEKSSP